VAAALVVGGAVTLACSSEGLVPDVTTDPIEDRPPATDTRTVDPPTFSNLPVTQP
jgi:hypothetical protein